MNEKEKLEELKNNLSLEQIKDIVYDLDGEPIMQGDILLCRTICHCGDSHKLYYYNNTHLFRCFTECSDTFDLFQLLIKTKRADNLPQAKKFVLNYFGIEEENDFFKDDSLLAEDWKIINSYNKNNEQENKKIIDFKIYDANILNNFQQPHIIPWEKEGISYEIIKRNNIKYNAFSQGIIIPHYDDKNNLIGIRERTLIKENEINGKYKPAIIGLKQYNHPLGFACYNLNNSKDNIRNLGKVVVYEGEKSTMLHASYFGVDADISVAICGSSLSNHQVELLRSYGAKELIIALDKQFKEIDDAEWRSWTKKLKQIHQKYGSLITISFIFDKWNLLDYKDSPIDKRAGGIYEVVPEEGKLIMKTDEDRYFEWYYNILCEKANKLLPYYNIDKIKPYGIYVYDKAEDIDDQYNVFDIYKEGVVFYTNNQTIINEALPIIEEIQNFIKKYYDKDKLR